MRAAPGQVARPALLERIRQEVQAALDLQSLSNASSKVDSITIHSKKINMKNCERAVLQRFLGAHLWPVVSWPIVVSPLAEESENLSYSGPRAGLHA